MARTRAGRAAGGSARAAAPPGGPASCAPRRPRRAWLSETPAAAIVLCHAALLIAPEFTHRVCTQRYAHAWMSDISPMMMTTEIPRSHSRITLRKRKTKQKTHSSGLCTKSLEQTPKGRSRLFGDAAGSAGTRHHHLHHVHRGLPLEPAQTSRKTAHALVSRSARPVLTHPLV